MNLIYTKTKPQSTLGVPNNESIDIKIETSKKSIEYSYCQKQMKASIEEKSTSINKEGRKEKNKQIEPNSKCKMKNVINLFSIQFIQTFLLNKLKNYLFIEMQVNMFSKDILNTSDTADYVLLSVTHLSVNIAILYTFSLLIKVNDLFTNINLCFLHIDVQHYASLDN